MNFDNNKLEFSSTAKHKIYTHNFMFSKSGTLVASKYQKFY